MDPDEEKDPVVRAILERTVPGYSDRPASCWHRCHCECHSNENIKHVMACCTGCGHGHTQVLAVYLEMHLKTCHGIGDGQ